MATRRTSTTRTSSRASAGTTRAGTRPKRASGLRQIATMAPLAIGLAATPLTNAPTPSPSPSGTHQITVNKGTFKPVCTLPFAGVLNPDSDNHCGITGGSSDPAKEAESTSKNDFCEATKPPEAVSYEILTGLQAKSVNIPKSIPDRKIVQDLGEGKYVSYIALVKDAHYSDVNAGEAVNCNIPGDTTNDIHIVLMPEGKTDECDSTTAEMSPHYRPAGWTPDAIMKASAGHPIRVTGHLFYDGSHSPCTASSRPNPKRASLWEIHPVYSFDVCGQTTIAQCQANTADWTPLEKVFASEPEQ